MVLWSVAELLALWPGAWWAERYLPLASAGAAPSVALAGAIGIWALGRGLRRGQRQAFVASIGVLLAASLWLLVARRSALAAPPALLVFLLARARAAFTARADAASARRGVALAAVGVPSAVVLGAVGVPGFVAGAVVVAGCVACAAGWLSTRPPVRQRFIDVRDGVAERARQIVDEHSLDHLGYFALRDDKEHFFHGRSMVSFAVVRGVCVVSPDPIGPECEREEVWAAFRRFADEHGWLVGVLGAGEGNLDFYRQERMRVVYIGDDAVVDCQSFQLAGRRLKSLRQGVQRVARRGHRVEIFEAAEVTEELRLKLRSLVTRTRLGSFERGYSMTLGRMFDPRDTGLMVGVCFDPEGDAVACCQFVPAPDGYCLDLMRREPSAAHGVVDFILVEMIAYVRRVGLHSLGLNFAAWRAIAAGARGDSGRERLLRWGVGQLSKSFQVESLWEFTRKYQPAWVGRYAVYDAIEDLAGCMLAVAKAESYWELPVIGRFMLPDVPEKTVVIERPGTAVGLLRDSLPSVTS